jgi:hypothetical protein
MHLHCLSGGNSRRCRRDGLRAGHCWRRGRDGLRAGHRRGRRSPAGMYRQSSLSQAAAAKNLGYRNWLSLLVVLTQSLSLIPFVAAVLRRPSASWSLALVWLDTRWQY